MYVVGIRVDFHWSKLIFLTSTAPERGYGVFGISSEVLCLRVKLLNRLTALLSILHLAKTNFRDLLISAKWLLLDHIYTTC